MKRLFIVIVLMLILIPAGAWAQSTVTSTNEANVSANPSIQQSFQAADPGQGRWFVPPAQPYQAPVVAYLGPWSSGSNILEDLRALPEVITLDQAKKMYNGGVSARINRMEDYSYQFQTCKLMNALPLTPLLGSDGIPVKNQDGKTVMIPDESKFKRVAFIFLQGDKKANTVDVISKSCIEAMKVGANSIYLMKKVTLTSTKSSGWGIGFGAVNGQLTGSKLEKSQAYSAGTGYNRATSEPVYKEGMVVLALRYPLDVTAQTKEIKK